MRTTLLMLATSVQMEPAPLATHCGPASDWLPTGMTSMIFIVRGSTLTIDVTGVPSCSPTHTSPSAATTPTAPLPADASEIVFVAWFVAGSMRVRLLPG